MTYPGGDVMEKVKVKIRKLEKIETTMGRGPDSAG
jgi:hypothetical protein